MKLYISVARAVSTKNWFQTLTEKEQKEYLEEHPRSRMKLMVRPAEIKQSLDPVAETKVVDGKRYMADGSPLPEHIQKLRIPPAWTDVKVNTNPDANFLASGRDSKGRLNCVYSEAFSKTQAEAKFRRVQELAAKFNSIKRQNEENRSSDDPKKKTAADCLRLIMHTGIRPGSTKNTKAEKQAYGATTLKGQHVVETDSGLELHFTGKKGVDLKIPVKDKETADMIRERAKAAGPDGNLFDTNAKYLSDYTHTMDGGSFKTKDFRTHTACSAALSLIEKMPVPKDKREYVKSVMQVAKIVSQKLGNTPVVCLQSYINPVCFTPWQMGQT